MLQESNRILLRVAPMIHFFLRKTKYKGQKMEKMPLATKKK